jgi:hypothetical protein
MLLLFGVFFAMLVAASPAAAEVPLVYSRCPRSSAPFDISGTVV